MSTIKKFLVASAIVGVAIGLSFVAGQRHAQKWLVLPQVPKVDTLFIRDTIMSKDPVYITNTKIDSIPYPVPVIDTLWQHDTLYVYLEREQVVWQDTLARVYASGIMPQVDSVQHFVREVIVTIEKTRYVKKPHKWGIGIHTGYGAFAKNGQISAAPYFGFGVSYNLFSW